jgi:nucleotide-binding universal stress UspA family protein
MFRKILIPLDGSPLAERIVAHMRGMMPPATTEFVLVSVVEPWRYSFTEIDFNIPDVLTEIRASAQHYLDRQSSQLQAAGYRVATQVGEGDPAQVILALSQATSADLIAMSTHGRSGFVRWALGSVAERVIQGATTPLFLIRESTPPPTQPPQRILVPLDGSLLAEQALPTAQALALAFGARITLLQVVQELDKSTRRIFFENEAEAEQTFAEWRAASGDYLAEVAGRLRTSDLAVETVVRFGDPDRTICEYASEAGIGLTVMSTHGRSGLSRWLYGSVTNKVLRSIDCPLVLVRNFATEESTF